MYLPRSNALRVSHRTWTGTRRRLINPSGAITELASSYRKSSIGRPPGHRRAPALRSALHGIKRTAVYTVLPKAILPLSVFYRSVTRHNICSHATLFMVPT